MQINFVSNNKKKTEQIWNIYASALCKKIKQRLSKITIFRWS